jgi:RNA polymerase sigma-70 factor, ECF subfamily
VQRRIFPSEDQQILVLHLFGLIPMPPLVVSGFVFARRRQLHDISRQMALRFRVTICSEKKTSYGVFMPPTESRTTPPALQQTPNEENAAIAAKLHAHDPLIIHELVVRYGSRLKRYLIRLTANRELAEDVLQETWIRVVTRGSQFRGDSQFVTWLFAIARNLVRDRQRRKVHISSLDEMTEEGELWHMELRDHGKSPLDQYVLNEKAGLVSAALDKLSPAQRNILIMRFFQEMSLLQIAKETAAPLPTVKARLYRSLTLLRQKMQAMYLTKPDKAYAA